MIQRSRNNDPFILCLMELKGNSVFFDLCIILLLHLSCDMVLRVYEQVRHKVAYVATENGLKLEILDLGRRGIVLSM